MSNWSGWWHNLELVTSLLSTLKNNLVWTPAFKWLFDLKHQCKNLIVITLSHLRFQFLLPWQLHNYRWSTVDDSVTGRHFRHLRTESDFRFFQILQDHDHVQKEHFRTLFPFKCNDIAAQCIFMCRRFPPRLKPIVKFPNQNHQPRFKRSHR